MANTAPRDAPCSVYRMYSRDGSLLYIGATSRGNERIREHRGRWPIDRVEWEHFPNRDAAFARERELIAALAPQHNDLLSRTGIPEPPCLDAPASDDPQERLRQLGAQRSWARREIREISAELPAAIRDALADGMEKKRAAELAHISRPALDEMLKRD